MTFVVILAGGVVRMTQSGMGCPDWPKCFGLWIPPINASQLPPDFEKYLDKQDIDHSFNVYHTWIEYINRLLGALLGLFIIPYVVIAVRKYRKHDLIVTLLACLMLIVVAFQGWTGKLVVDHNLAVVKVTIHMLLALFLLAIPLLIIHRIEQKRYKVPKHILWITGILLGLSIVQMLLGTQVREEVDIVSKALGYQQRELWINRLGNSFIIHRSFSWLLMLVGIGLFYMSRKETYAKHTNSILIILVFSLILGVVMNYMDMLAIAQPLHLLAAFALIMQVFYLFIKMTKFLIK